MKQCRRFRPFVEELEGRLLLSAGYGLPGAGAFAFEDLAGGNGSATAAHHQSAGTATPLAPSATGSTNWSGYSVTSGKNTVTSVSGTWKVPTVTASANPQTYSSVWVGIDGFSSSTVEQIGTEQDVINGTKVYDVWWEMYPTNYEQVITTQTTSTGATIKGSSFAISPGDTISASVVYVGTNARGLQLFKLTIADTTKGEFFTTTQAQSSRQNSRVSRSSAEWILEAPTVGGGQSAVANFSPATFTSASATINGATGPIDDGSFSPSSGTQANLYSIDMVSQSGATLDQVGGLTDSGSSSSFTITYG